MPCFIEDGHQGVHRHPARTHESQRDQEAPDQEIRKEHRGHHEAKRPHRAFEKRLPGRQLPAGQPLVQHELQEGTNDDRPENRGSHPTTCEGCSGQLPGTDTGGGDEQAGPDDREQLKSAGAFHSRVSRHRGRGPELAS